MRPQDFTFGELLGEARAYLWVAASAFILGLIFLLVELESADLVIWTGRCVPAPFDGGIAHYTVAGQPFTADNPPLADRSRRTVTVCYDASDPGHGYIVHPAAYWVEGGSVLGPLAVGLVSVAVGILKGRRRLLSPLQLPPLPTFTQRSG